MITMDFKKGAIGPGMIKGAIIGLVFLTILLSILPSLIPTAAESVKILATNLSDTNIYGPGAAAVGAQLDDWTGYFWVLGPFVLIISVIMGIFMRRRR